MMIDQQRCTVGRLVATERVRHVQVAVADLRLTDLLDPGPVLKDAPQHVVGWPGCSAPDPLFEALGQILDAQLNATAEAIQTLDAGRM